MGLHSIGNKSTLKLSNQIKHYDRSKYMKHTQSFKKYDTNHYI